MCAAAERHPLERVFAVFGAVAAEAFRIETSRFAPEMFRGMREPRTDADEAAGRNAETLVVEVARGAERQPRHRRTQTHRLLHHPAHGRQRPELFEVRHSRISSTELDTLTR